MQEVEKKKREISSSGFLGNSIKSTYDNSSSSSTYDQNSTVFVELGAGKGLLGLAVSCIKVRPYLFHFHFHFHFHFNFYFHFVFSINIFELSFSFNLLFYDTFFYLYILLICSSTIIIKLS